MHMLRHHPLAAALRALRWPLAAAAGALAPGLVLANPSGGQVAAGQATIGNTAANTLTINQASHSAVINWQQFSVDGGEFVVFNQPNASATVLNRVVGGLPSEVLGNLSANGRVFLVNPNGVMFGQGARVDVGGLVASTMNIADSDFMDGRYVFTGAPAGSRVSNAGQIVARDGGFVVLAGEQVSNSGLVQARLGKVALGSGSAMTLGLDEAGLVSFSVDAGSVSSAAGIDNAGDIAADGGSVILAARAARALIGGAVNNSGTLSARSISEHEGSVYLSAEGGDIRHEGLIDASGTGGSAGGEVRLVASNELITTDASRIDARGAGGGSGGFVELSGHRKFHADGEVSIGEGGALLIDPDSIAITDVRSCGADACYAAADIETQLDAGVDVFIIAGDRISVVDFGADGMINSANPAGDLLFGIGSPTTGQLPGGPYTRGAPTLGSGNISFLTPGSQSINIAGAFAAIGGSGAGNVNLGQVIATQVTAQADGSLTLGGTIAASNGSVDLRGIQGVFGTGQTIAATGSGTPNTVTIRAIRGAVDVGTVAVDSDNFGSIAIDIRARDGIKTGDLGVTIHSTGDGDFLSAGIVLQNAYSEDANGNFVADVNALRSDVITGNISVTTDAAGNAFNGAETFVQILNQANAFFDTSTSTISYAGGGGLSTGVIVAIANASATDSAFNSVQLFADGDVSTRGNAVLLMENGAAGNEGSDFVVVTDNGGDISLGTINFDADGFLQLQGSSVNRNDASDRSNLVLGPVGGTLSDLFIDASGSVNVGGQGFSADNIDITAGAGNLVLGNLTARDGSVFLTNDGGSITTGTVNASHMAFGDETGFDFAVIDIFARDGISTGDLNLTVTAANSLLEIEAAVALATEVDSTGIGGGNIGTGNISVTINTGGNTGISSHGQVVISNGAEDISSTSTPMFVGGGKVTTGAISVNATGSPVDPQTCSTCTPTQSNADVFISGDDDISLGAITLAAQGASANGTNLGVTALDGGNIGMGATNVGNSAYVNLLTQRGRTDTTRLGSIDVASLSGGFSSLLASTSGSLSIRGGNLQQQPNALPDRPAPSSFAVLVGGQVGLQNLTLDAGALELDVTATGDLTVDNSDLVAQAIVLKGANMTLSGFLSGGTVMLQAPGVVQTSSTGTLDVDAGAVGVSARLIDLNRSSWTIGSNTVPLGQDSNLVSEVRRLAPSLQPALSAPNAAFEAQDGVTVGNLNFTDSGYLFLRSPSFFSGTISVGSGPLFFNARPFDDSLGIDVGAITSSPAFDALQTTYVLGGTGYNGDITVPPPSKALELGNDNVIFLTQGKVFNTDQIQTSGQVVVLGGTVTNQPPPQPPPPLDEQQMAAAGSAQLVVSDLGEQFMADSDTSLEFEDSSLVEETSDAPDDDLQCK